MDIKGIIKASGHTITFVADKLGITRQSMYQRLNHNTSMDIVVQMMNAIGMKVVVVPKDKPVLEGEYTL